MESNSTDSHINDADVMRNSFNDIVWSVLSTTAFFVVIIFFVTCIRVLLGQKTRNPQQRRMYVGSRARPSLDQAEPTIYVSPSNLPPPPKYEAMAPPSYEEVVGVHYPNYQIQPITQPISAALVQSASSNTTQTSSAVTPNNEAPAVVTVTNEERRTSVARS